MTIPTDTQRAEFEAWAKERGGNILRHAERSHQYASSTVQGWWISWQAATERERERAARICQDRRDACRARYNAGNPENGDELCAALEANYCAAAIRKGET